MPVSAVQRSLLVRVRALSATHAAIPTSSLTPSRVAYQSPFATHVRARSPSFARYIPLHTVAYRYIPLHAISQLFLRSLCPAAASKAPLPAARQREKDEADGDEEPEGSPVRTAREEPSAVDARQKATTSLGASAAGGAVLSASAVVAQPASLALATPQEHGQQAVAGGAKGWYRHSASAAARTRSTH